MARKYTNISIDIEFDEIADSISSKDLLSEISARNLDSEEQFKLQEIAYSYIKQGEFDNLELNCIQEMKMRHFLTIIDKYSIEDIETKLP